MTRRTPGWSCRRRCRRSRRSRGTASSRCSRTSTTSRPRSLSRNTSWPRTRQDRAVGQIHRGEHPGQARGGRAALHLAGTCRHYGRPAGHHQFRRAPLCAGQPGQVRAFPQRQSWRYRQGERRPGRRLDGRALSRQRRRRAIAGGRAAMNGRWFAVLAWLAVFRPCRHGFGGGARRPMPIAACRRTIGARRRRAIPAASTMTPIPAGPIQVLRHALSRRVGHRLHLGRARLRLELPDGGLHLCAAGEMRHGARWAACGAFTAASMMRRCGSIAPWRSRSGRGSPPPAHPS